MSNYLSLAVVTAALREFVQTAVKEAVPGANVRVGPPRASTPSSGPEVCLYLYQVTPNASLRNRELANRDHAGALVRRPEEAVDLHYLICFFGEQELASERMAGKVMARLNAFPILTREQLHAAIHANGPNSFLHKADLAQAIDPVRITPVYLSLEELSKLWTVFFQVAHRISLQYMAGPVLIDSDVHVKSIPNVEHVDLKVHPEGDDA